MKLAQSDSGQYGVPGGERSGRGECAVSKSMYRYEIVTEKITHS